MPLRHTRGVTTAKPEQVWVQVRDIGLMVPAEQGLAVAADIMTKTRSPIGSVHQESCKLAASPKNVCSCTPTMVRGEGAD